jgi:hypothetical protein
MIFAVSLAHEHEEGVTPLCEMAQEEGGAALVQVEIHVA